MKHIAKPYPHTYQHRRSSCEKLLAALQRELSQILQEHQAAEAREQVLLDWIRTQELVLLQLSSIPEQQADAAANEAMGAKAEACGLLSSQAACYDSYVGGLVASAAPGKLQQVLHMTPADWSNTFLSSWSQLVQLLELVAHEDDTTGTNCTTRQPSAAPPSHWLRVAQRLELSATQLLHFATAAKEQQRLRGRTLQEARQLADTLAGLSLLVQAAQQIERRNNRPLQPAGQLAAAAGGEGPVQVAEQQGTAAALTPPFLKDKSTPSELPLTEQQLLDRNLRVRTMYSQLFSTFIFNTLTPVQIAKLWTVVMVDAAGPDRSLDGASQSTLLEQFGEKALALFNLHPVTVPQRQAQALSQRQQKLEVPVALRAARSKSLRDLLE
eukprot:gene3492-3762_t